MVQEWKATTNYLFDKKKIYTIGMALILINLTTKQKSSGQEEMVGYLPV